MQLNGGRIPQGAIAPYFGKGLRSRVPMSVNPTSSVGGAEGISVEVATGASL
jgi:hypothetical protein